MRTAREHATAASVAKLMATAPPFDNLPAAAVQALAGAGRMRDYRKGTYLFHQGDEAPDIFFLCSGRIEINTLSATGHRQLHTTLDRPQFFGEFGVLGDMPRTATAVALEDSSVSVLPGDVFVSFLEGQPRAARALLHALARQVAAQEALVEDLLFLDLKGRVAKRLLGLVSPSLEELPDDGAVVPSMITHADLASLSGGSRENVTRILSEFQRRGLVDREGRRYILKNVTGLARLAGL